MSFAVTPQQINATNPGPINVKWFGAVGNGIADDTAAIQSAIDSVPSNTAIQIQIPSGIYLLNTNVEQNGRNVSWNVDGGASFIGAGVLPFPFTDNSGDRGAKNSFIAGQRGTLTTPTNEASPLAQFYKVTNAAIISEMNATLTVGIAKTEISDNGTRAQGFFAEALDYAGGSGTFVEGYRGHGIVKNGATNGSGYGGISVGGAETNVQWDYLVGHEAVVINKSNAAPDPTSFNKWNYSASFVATSNLGGTNTVDAAYVVNPFTTPETVFRTGLLIGEDSTDFAGVANRANLEVLVGNFGNITTGLYGGNVSYAALLLQNGASSTIRVRNGNNTDDHNIFYYDNTNRMILGTQAESIYFIPPNVYSSGNVIVNGTILGNVTATGTTVSRSLANRFSDTINVKDFGAVGNGIADDTAAIQAAVNFAGTNNVALQLSSFHAVSSQINVPANTTIIGAGSKTTINALSGTYNMFSLNGDDITIQNLLINDSSKTAGWDFIIDCGATSVNRTLLQNIVTTSSYGFLTDTGSGGGIHITTRLNFIQCKQHRGPGIQVERAYAFLYWKEVAIDFGGSFNPNYTGFSITGTGIFGGGLVLEDCSVSGTSGTTTAANQNGFSITDFSDVWFNRTLADTCDGKGYNLFLVNKVYFTAASAGHCNDTGFNLNGVGGVIGDIQIYGRKNLSSPAANIDGLRFSSCTDISLGSVLVRECTGHGINKNGLQSGPIRISGLISQENGGYGISSSGDSAFLVVGAQLNANTSGDYDMDGIYDYLQVSQLTNGSVVSVGPGPISG